MANEEKILEMLVQLQAGQTWMQGQMDSMQGQINGIQGQVNSLQDDMHRVKAYLELDVGKRFDAVNEVST